MKAATRCKPTRQEVANAILEGQNARKGFAGIADDLQVTRAWVGSVAKEMVKDGRLEEHPYGQYTVSEAAELLGLSRDSVHAACASGLVKSQLWTNVSHHTIRIAESELAAIPIAVALLKERYCYTCGRYFTPLTAIGNPKGCSDECRRKRDLAGRRESMRQGRKSPDALYNRLKAGLPLPDDDWRTIKEAAAASGISGGTIRNLIKWGVLPTSPHPTRRRGDKPMATVAVNQCCFIHQYYQKLQQE